jgi:diguanylate cyclase (GGDEF)-like protein
LKNQATRDPLTALYNRRYFEEEVSKRITQSLKNNQDFSVLMVDADHFKKINDTYGHKTGDAVLIDLAQTCEKALREDDIVARYGGEEFVIFLSKVNAEKAQTVAERMRQSIANRIVRAEEGAEVKFTVSIGISSSAVSDNIETLIKTADEALYKAKSNGRNRSEIFTPKDLKSFSKKSKESKKSSSRHPVFEKEDDEEISLLDGVAAGSIIGTSSNIEDGQ